MRDVDVLIQVFVEIEMILAEHIQPGHQQDPEAVIEGIFRVMDRADVSAAVERLRSDVRRRQVAETVAMRDIEIITTRAKPRPGRGPERLEVE